MRVLILLLSLATLLCGCQRVGANDMYALDIILQRVQNELGGADAFIAADTDFALENIGNPNYLSESAVCFGADNETKEIGIFRLNDRTKAEQLKQSIHAYLQNEREALLSLSALYPSEELEERLSLYQNATVGSEGMLVYYLVLNPSDTKKALTALTGRQQ